MGCGKSNLKTKNNLSTKRTVEHDKEYNFQSTNSNKVIMNTMNNEQDRSIKKIKYDLYSSLYFAKPVTKLTSRNEGSLSS